MTPSPAPQKVMTSTIVPWCFSILFHSTFALAIFFLPASAQKNQAQPNIELMDRQLPELKPPPLPEEKSAPPVDSVIPTLPKKSALPTKARRETPPPPSESPPGKQAPADSDETGPKTFGIEMSGTTTAASGQGVKLPVGESLGVSPKAIRKGKASSSNTTSTNKGFKPSYGSDEEAPVAVVTTPPKVLNRVTPEYPEQVRDLGIEGKVILELIIDVQGKVETIKILKSLHPDLDAAAIKAAKQMRFSPASMNGAPVKIKIPYTFTFVLD